MTNESAQLAADQLREDVLDACRRLQLALEPWQLAALGETQGPAREPWAAVTPPGSRPCHLCRRPTRWTLYGVGATCDTCFLLVPASVSFRVHP